MNEAELDTLIGRWLGGDTEVAADGVVERAMQVVAGTPQEGIRLPAMALAFAGAPVAWAAAIGIALVIGLGVVFGTRLVGDDRPPTLPPNGHASETLRPSEVSRMSDPASPIASELQIDLPDGWSFDGKMLGGTSWVNPQLEATIRIRAGAASKPYPFCTETWAGRCGDGTPSPACKDDGSTYCRQVQIADLAALRAVLTTENPPLRETTRRTTKVGGTEAWLIESTQAFDQGRRQLQKTYVLFIHDGRPFVLIFKTTADAPPSGWVDDIVAGLRFE